MRELFPIGEAFESVTVNGWVLEVLGRFPQAGDAFHYGDLTVTVEPGHTCACHKVQQDLGISVSK